MCGKTIDALWQLDDLVYRRPSWHAQKLVSSKADSTSKDADDDDSDAPPSFTPFARKQESRKRILTIMASPGDESDQSMPSLQTVSDSSEDEVGADDDSDNEDGENESDDESDDEDEYYDEDEEDNLRDMLREAMDVATADPDFYNPRREATDFKDLAEDRKGNPFIKLLGSLRGVYSNTCPLRPSADCEWQVVCSLRTRISRVHPVQSLVIRTRAPSHRPPPTHRCSQVRRRPHPR